MKIYIKAYILEPSDFQKMSGQDDLRAEIQQLQEENEKLRQKLQEAQLLRKDKELTQGVKRKEWAGVLKQKQLEQELQISLKRMARNNQILEGLMGKLKKRSSLPVYLRNEASMYMYNELETLAKELQTPAKKHPMQGCLTTDTGGTSRSLDVETAEKKSETKTGQTLVKISRPNPTRQQTKESHFHRKQKDPLIVEIPGRT